MNFASSAAQLLLPALLLLTAGPLAGQGKLTPTGPPAATMKTLAQIEPRTDVQTLALSPPYKISSPGSYFLSGNLSVTTGHAIVIDADNVTLDLGGFAILSAPGNTLGTAIFVEGVQRQLTIRNGNIGVQTGVAAGFLHGIFTPDQIIQALVSDVQISQVSSNGIYLDFLGVAERCTLSGVGGTGIVAEVVRDCVVTAGGTAINARTVVNCVGKSTGAGIGIVSLSARDSIGTAVSGTGLEAETATGCTGTSGSGFGLRALTASQCTGTSTSNVGLGWVFTELLDNTTLINVATNCRGISFATLYPGLAARSAAHCYGTSGNIGVYAMVADGCTAAAKAGSYGIFANIAIGCVVTGTNNLGTYAQNKYNMPP